MDEGIRLVEKMKEAGVRTEVVVTEDTPHDLILMAMVWKKKDIEAIWEGALRFLKTINVK
jgi:tRNA A-37 threonylcarbamoyl transferase component Bud32